MNRLGTNYRNSLPYLLTPPPADIPRAAQIIHPDEFQSGAKNPTPTKPNRRNSEVISSQVIYLSSYKQPSKDFARRLSSYRPLPLQPFASMRRTAVFLFTAAVSVSAIQVDPGVLDACPGYSAMNVKTRNDGLTADIVLLANPCNVFGDDIQKLSLNVTYETGMFDLQLSMFKTITQVRRRQNPSEGRRPSFTRYKVPESVLPRPNNDDTANAQSASIRFNYTTSPFSLSISRTSTHEVLFTTAGYPLIFEP